MKVIILTEGGKNMGIGHLARCLSLYQAFEDKDINAEIIVNGDKTLKDSLRNVDHHVFNWLIKKEKIFEIINGAEITIIDSYLADLEFYKKVSNKVTIPVYIDDNKRINYPKGIVVNGSIYAGKLHYPKKKEVTYLLGAKHIPLRREFWNLPKKGIKENIESVMITFGGNDQKNMTSIIFKFLTDEYPELIKNVIIGHNFQNAKTLEDMKDRKTNLIYSPDEKKMKSVMLESDIAISAGGQTLYELARVGIPTIGICVAENQRMNLESWQITGFLKYIGWYNDQNFLKNLKSSLEQLVEANERRKKSETGRKLVDGNGSLKIVNTILSELLKDRVFLRKANIKDALDIFNLYNDETVRRNSFNQEKITWKDHLDWLRKKIKDKNCVIFVVDNSDKFYGQVRFDINRTEKEAVMSISIEKYIRGLGLSSIIIIKSIDEFLKIHTDISLIKAYIKEKNIVSLKSFEKAHFKFLENIMIKGNKAKLYVREVDHANTSNEREKDRN